MNRFGVLAAACLALTCSAGACAVAPRRPRVVSLPAITARPVFDIEWISTYETALATIRTIIERKLRLPPMGVSLHFFPDRKSFEAKLVAVGYDASLARDTADSMTAVGGFRAVLLNEGKLASVTWPRRISILAHELAHTIQYELGGGHRGTSDQWLREGFGEWVALNVLEELNVSTLEDGRRAGLDALRNGVRDRSQLTAFEEMVTFPQWVALGRRRGGSIVYDHAFVASDFLIRRHGIESVVAYFRRFAQSADRLGNFRAAFGEELPAFARAFGEYVRPPKRQEQGV